MLQFITHPHPHYTPYEGAKAALEGGCRWIQLRLKEASPQEAEAQARQLLPLCREYGATFIIDDRVELAALVGADGVHLGKNDMHPLEARAILGEKAIIGGTANTFADMEQLHAWGVNYIGLGPFRYTTTKEKLSSLLGLEGYRTIMEQCRAAQIELPVVAIGGITREDIPELLQTGVTGIALSGTILRAPNPQEETQIIVDTIQHTLKR